MINVLERLEYTCISTIPFLCLELQEDIVTFLHLLGKTQGTAVAELEAFIA